MVSNSLGSDSPFFHEGVVLGSHGLTAWSDPPPFMTQTAGCVGPHSHGAGPPPSAGPAAPSVYGRAARNQSCWCPRAAAHLMGAPRDTRLLEPVRRRKLAFKCLSALAFEICSGRLNRSTSS